MAARGIALTVVGVLLTLVGVVFALQGAGFVGGSSLMDNNPDYIYIGAVVAIVGIALAAVGLWPRRGMRTPIAPSQP